MNQGQDLQYSDDEESYPSDHNHNESTILLSTINNSVDRAANVPYTATNPHSSDYGSLNSPTSSLGDSDYDCRESQFRTYHKTLGDTTANDNTPSIKSGDQKLASILLTVILICSFSVAFLAGSSQGTGHGANDQGEGGISGQSRMHYFPFPDGSIFAPGEGLSSSLETSKYVPFKTVDRKEMGIEASQIVFPELFHSSLRLSKNSTKVDAGAMSSPLPLLKIPFPTVSLFTQ